MAPKDTNEIPSTYPGIWKYPTNRDVPFRMAEDWLDAKRKDDDIGSLWRVHDKLYNFEPFIDNHPGGWEWLELSRGTDITEAFEASHNINIDIVHGTLGKFYVKDAPHPRISPFTFKEDGFYKTLKRRIAPILKEVGTGPSTATIISQDALVALFFVTGAYAAVYNSKMMAIFCGTLLAFLTTGGHNFMHIRDNWRKYYVDLSLLSSREWRITHFFSHHLYPNTLMDIELVLLPTYQFLPNRNKPWIQRYFSIVYSHLVYAGGFWMDIVKRAYHVLSFQQPLRFENLFPLIELGLLIAIADNTEIGVKTWAIIHTSCSYVLLTIGANAAHHHPTIYHDGDEPLADPDFGIGQLDATRDRAETLFQNPFVALITFGEHPLHHLFPTLCHSKIQYLRETFEQTVRDFKLDYPGIPQLELYLGCHKQLARTDILYRKKAE